MKRLLSLIAVISLGCSTEQKQVQFPVEIIATAPDAPTEEGWTVKLDSAVASVGPVRFYPGHVLLTERVKRLLWMPFGGVAQAHPGHYIPGEALGEVLDRKVIDLLGTPTLLGTASAVTGDYGSLQLSLLPPATGGDNTGGHSLRLKGTATKDTTTVTFDASVDLTTAIEGIQSEATVDETLVKVQINFHLKRWLDRVDFTTATAPDASSPAVFADGSQAQNALVRGASDTSGYVVSWIK